MSDKMAEAADTQAVELAVYQLDSLSILPSIAARILSGLIEQKSSDLAEIIESVPALTAKAFSLLNQEGINLAEEKFFLCRALDKLPAEAVRNAFFSIKVSLPSDNDKAIIEKELLLHCLAVGCCAAELAVTVSPQINPQLAYSAGLLHDIGKLALNEVMPKSSVQIAEEAKTQSASSLAIEQKHLGTDHTILGKRLGQKWHFPEEIILAIWLHHSNTGSISQGMPEAAIAQIVRLADLIVRQCGPGQSGSYDTADLPDEIAQSLAITQEQLERIRSGLGEKVQQKSKVLGLDLPDAVKKYCEAAHSTAVQLARESTKLSLENRRLQSTSSHLDFMTEFLLSTNSAKPPIEIAQDFAVRWQKFYQTGRVCLYIVPSANSEILEAVVVENLLEAKKVCLRWPADSEPIPKPITKDFAILEAGDYVEWLFDQLDVEFELGQSKILPLLSGGKAVGAIVFELRYPGDVEEFRENFRGSASVGAAVLDIALAQQRQQHFAEQFSKLLTKAGERPGQQITQQQEPAKQVQAIPEEEKVEQEQETLPKVMAGESSIAHLVEVAAGAAHELNNPLSVISGRTEILVESETDPEKKAILKQIQENANKLSHIINDLMSFASPPEPKVTKTSIKQLLDEASQLAAQKQNIEELDVKVEIAEDVKDVFVDSAQIVSAIADIFCNSLESYEEGFGPIKVAAVNNASGSSVKLQISDTGCGMDFETLQKAIQPFFSYRPAGRKRGMGLAYAVRLTELNGGSLDIRSKVGSGTTVTISLPSKGKP